MIIFVVCLFSITHGQNKYVGDYLDYSGSRIQIFPDFTFKHLSSYPNLAWAKGTWRASNDTIYLVWVPIYDTLIYYDTLRFADSPKRVKMYSIVLSFNEKSGLVTKESASMDSQFQIFQNGNFLPKKLVYKRNVLYDFDKEGKIIKYKYKYDNSIKKFRSGYKKVKKKESNRIKDE